jgi:catechol-2,3-dioxygenase
VYFSDPEGNGIEIFCDSPWHVQQPQVRPWNIEASNEEVIEQTRREFEGKPGFGAIEDFYASQRDHFGE